MKMPRAKSGPVNRRAAHAAELVESQDPDALPGQWLMPGFPQAAPPVSGTPAKPERAGLAADPKGPLFPSAGTQRGSGRLSSRPIKRTDALKMIKRRAKSAGLPGEICAHSFRGTGITEYLRAGGTLETAARIAGHESTRTTQLYNRLQDEVSLDEIERIHI